MLSPNERTGNTIVSSVSISKEFKKLIDENDISPTNALRKGVAVELFEMGIFKYQSETNKIRKEKTDEFLRFMDSIKKFQEKKDKYLDSLKIINKNIQNILIEFGVLSKLNDSQTDNIDECINEIRKKSVEGVINLDEANKFLKCLGENQNEKGGN